MSIVSIPERVWGGLERDTDALHGQLKAVSIPERVWGGLEQVDAKPKDRILGVSIPERVWGGLERQLRVSICSNLLVSIPERVWGGLEPSNQNYSKIQPWFQSLRGFGVGWSKLYTQDRLVCFCFNP